MIAGLAGGVFAPVASLGFGVPLWVSLPAAALVFVGTRLALAPRRLFEGIDAATVDRSSLELAHDVLAAAQADCERLRAIARSVADAAVHARLDHLHAVAQRVVGEVEHRPARLNSVRRLLTYYLPAAVRLGQGFGVLENANRPDTARLRATGAMIERLDEAFARHADKLNEVDVDGLDVELKLLGDALRAEERERPVEPATGAEAEDTPPRGTPSWR